MREFTTVKSEKMEQDVIINANRLSRFLHNKDIPEPTIFKGQFVQFVWETEIRYLEIEVQEDNYHIHFQNENGIMDRNENNFSGLLKLIRLIYK